MKVLVTGAEGQLGYELKQRLAVLHSVFAYDIELDITDKQAVVEEITRVRPEIVLHCAAMTDVDACETEPDRAAAVNEAGTANVVTGCQQVNAIMVYVSTDFVFDGQKNVPYVETDAPNPLNVYGRTKLGGENAVKNGLDNCYIIRTSWLFGRRGGNFVKTVLRLAEEKGELAVVDDQTGSPTYAPDLADKIIELTNTGAFGTYHIANAGQTTWYGFAREILRAAGRESVPVRPISSDALGRSAKRPAYSVLGNEALAGAGIAPLRDFHQALDSYFGNTKEKGNCR